jgi:ferredoxin
LCTPVATGSAESAHTDDDPVRTVAAVRVVIDAEKCQGHNRCYAIAPELFDVDDYGQSLVRGDGVVPPELVEKAHLAVANCPEYAISIVEEDGDT